MRWLNQPWSGGLDDSSLLGGWRECGGKKRKGKKWGSAVSLERGGDLGFPKKAAGRRVTVAGFGSDGALTAWTSPNLTIHSCDSGDSQRSFSASAVAKNKIKNENKKSNGGRTRYKGDGNTNQLVNRLGEKRQVIFQRSDTRVRAGGFCDVRKTKGDVDAITAMLDLIQ